MRDSDRKVLWVIAVAVLLSLGLIATAVAVLAPKAP